MISGIKTKLYKDYIQFEKILRKFKSDIKKPNGKLTLEELAELNSIFKKEYYK